MKRYADGMDDILDDHIMAQLDQLITEEKFCLDDTDYKYKLIKYINQLVRV